MVFVIVAGNQVVKTGYKNGNGNVTVSKGALLCPPPPGAEALWPPPKAEPARRQIPNRTASFFMKILLVYLRFHIKRKQLLINKHVHSNCRDFS
jgi:hypothetical protein